MNGNERIYILFVQDVI